MWPVPWWASVPGVPRNAIWCVMGALIWLPPGTQGCTGRTVLNKTSGVVTDGPGKYPPSAHCEWLIDAGSSDKSIQLVFESMRTECSYDYLFIYDGNSFSDHLLGSFSGSTKPDPIIATTGYMLIYFYSDRNYVLEGFKAHYTITDCPFNCSGNGQCDVSTNKCNCYADYTGEHCERNVCPTGCEDHGRCDQFKEKCLCKTGYTGMDCKMATNSSSGQSTWYRIAPHGVGFTARTGHAGAFIAKTNSLYVFGGNTLNSLLDDLSQYDFGINTWRVVNRSSSALWPRARHNHAIVVLGDGFYMYGGLYNDGAMSDELWLYNTTTKHWQLKATASSVKPPQVASHTLTLVDDMWLYLFGGRTAQGEFLSDIHRIRILKADHWEKIDARGGKLADRRLVGHSTIYHPESKSLLVFGGFSPDYARFPKRTDFLHAYHIENNYWTQIYYDIGDSETDRPKDRAFHTATLMGNYMVVYGGNCHIHHDEEICYDHHIHYYHLGCHRWVSHSKMEEAYPAKSPSVSHRGRFSHVAVPAYGNTLLISGGYSGSVLGDLVAYSVPTGIAKNWDASEFWISFNHCKNVTDYDHCKEDPECVWCMELPALTPAGLPSGCIHRSRAQTCVKDVRSGKCPGICSALHDCASCTVQGQGALTVSGPMMNMWHNEKCAWCVKAATCQKIDMPAGACDPMYSNKLIVLPWWGKNSSRPHTIDKCRLEDYPAGLHWILYRHPMDLKHPDNVEIKRKTGLTFQFEPIFDSENIPDTVYTSRFEGFIHPMGAESSNGHPLKVYLVSVAADAQLFLSTDTTKEHKALIAELTNGGYVTKQARTNEGQSEIVFPDENAPSKYYMVQIAKQEVAGPKVTQVASNMQLEWTGALAEPSRIRQEFSAEFLEPYNDAGVCRESDSCMGCMTNTACGWCPTNRACVLKVDLTGNVNSCGPVSHAHYLVTGAMDCAVCADYISCDTCTQDPLCEWLSHEARCLRQGRFNTAVRNVSLCPLSCRDRTNCMSCLSERNECAWCEQTRTCFPFVEYTMSYAYGGCTQWVDSMSKQQCHDCHRHGACGNCLADFQCGWCGNVDNPTLGRCLHGDFTGPKENGTCAALVAAVTNVSGSEPATWSYGVCPDVHECRLGLHDCHPDATCTNTWDSYICTCNRGFMGNGKDICNKTCYYDCTHGHCSESPSYECLCDVGWTGPECNTNCGCHNHSTCLTAVGVCDQCQHWSTGEHCETCRPGAYGNATTTGCIACDCNGHGDVDQDVCNATDGVCYCKDNTEGDHCQRCKNGYYGDPSGGQRCYLRCEGRTILGNITSGALGSHAGNGVKNMAHAYCLWILTIHSDLTNLRLISPVPTITFSMETDIKTLCSRDYVYVYDGIPSFMTSNARSTATLLAAYCGYNHEEPLRVEAKSGYITVYFEANIEPSTSSTRGFNATYRANSCEEECHSNRVCMNDRCVCQVGYGGIDCSVQLCPHNCSASIGQGTCDAMLGQCVCVSGYGGPACDVIISDRVGVYSSVFDPWRAVGQDAFNSSLSRMGHSLIACGPREFYMFGGYSLSHGLLNDLWKWDLDTGKWSIITPATRDQPKPRYFHAAVCVITTRAMYVFGGLTEKGGAVREMWKFTLDSKRWSRLPVADPDEDALIPPMAGHTMTLVDATRVYILGGFSATNYFSEKVYEYDASNNKWEEIPLTGSQPTGLYGHSTVYHSSSNGLYVFGGHEYQTDKTEISSSLYSIDLETKTWSLLPSELNNGPSGRAFHAAVSTPNYMVVLGGRTPHNDFDSSAYAYRYGCNHWTDVTEGSDVIGDGIPSVIGPAAVTRTTGGFNDIYFMGGFNGLSHGSLVKLMLPFDLCTMSRDERSCLNMLGCAACIDEDTNITYCYTNQDQARFDCAHGTAWRFAPGTVCDIVRIETRECNNHRTCTECLARWPTYRYHERVCQWCSNCAIGKCIPKGKDCQRENVCERQQRVIKSSNDCVERLCQAADCDKCANLGNCIWTRQFKRSSEVGRTLSLIPIYDWNCVVKSLLEATPYQVQSSPPNMCPLRCHGYNSCTACINAVGGEGGSQECVWSVPMQECMPPAYLTLRCSNGECGLILTGQPNQCPQNCSIHVQCSQCLATPGCGWCAIGGLNGLGVCMEGGLTGPHLGMCLASNLSLGATEPLPEKIFNWTQQSVAPHFWSFGQCLPENECLNGHHNCDQSENCTDLPHGFRCDCKVGYARDASHKCKPDCKQQCEPNGDCVAPNKCQCHFGYVGHNCSTECLCNRHSDCKSVTQRGTCLACQNHTKGMHCQECKPLFVGDPVDGGQCKSCSTFCNNHSEVCLSHDQYHLVISLGNQPQLNNLSMMMHHGPKSEKSAICIGCREFTQGDRCEECQNGHFRRDDDPKAKCEKCKCNLHSDVCDKDSGINCDCKNNTKSPRCEENQPTSSPQCYELQCSECVDSFLGKPTEKHQCYRQMTVDRDYCFDPTTQMNCNLDPSALLRGRTVFFAVQPKYLNVDIRITLDVTRGAVDLFFSPTSDSYTISVDPATGIHDVDIDPKYVYDLGTHNHLRVTREADMGGLVMLNSTDPRGQRSVTATNKSNTNQPTVHTYEEIVANDFNTFIKLMHKDVFLRVKNVQHRLVITLPQGVHELKVSQFYLVLVGTGTAMSNATFGNLFFRQDQPHIDLFVFFSVFFSCFFLFLAKCVFLWKIKQAMDAQRSRHRHRLEMQHLASRPFSRAKVIIDPDPSEFVHVNTTSTPLPRKTTLPMLYSKYSLNSDNFEPPYVEEKFTLKPLALEPTDDGIAAVGTFLFQLPGGANTPMHACLGSCLIQSSRVLFPNPHQPKSVYIRRQPSSSA